MGAGHKTDLCIPDSAIPAILKPEKNIAIYFIVLLTEVTNLKEVLL
jgi:hypothetical protein